MSYQEKDGRLTRKFDTETVTIEAWGKDSLRVRVTRRPEFTGNDWALMSPNATYKVAGSAKAEIGTDGSAAIRNGRLEARFNKEGWLSFYNAKGQLLLEEYWRNRNDITRYTGTLNLAGRELRPIPGGDWQITARFEAKDDERFFGMGQYQDGYLDKKGAVLELAHRNTQSSVPFAISSRGYGFLWNNPAIGRVSFAKNLTEWRVEDSLELDYWVTAGDTPAEIEEQYAAVTGTVPEMPDFGLGFTQCKMRYKNQEELLSVAREYKKRGLPLDVIVADFFHWTIQGEWKFDPVDWPDVKGMVKELKSLGIELMVSIWPTVDSRSSYFGEMLEKGYLISVDRGLRINMNWMGECVFFDPTNPGAREYIFSKAKEHYYDNGIKVFWLDEAEPEFGIYDFDIYRYHLGPALQVSNVYPMMYAKAFYDGLKALGETKILNLVRTAWAGSQRYGALTWSGDIHSSFRALREQVAAGLSMGLAGIPWWTTDIGGFIGGDPDDPHFRELLVRWFQWGVFCPVFRLHGDRVPYQGPETEWRNGVHQFGSGAKNEIWSFGDEAYPILAKYLKTREALKPYVRELMRAAHEKGTPIIRPLFYDFPQDPEAWNQDTGYLFGPDVLVAPILEEGQRERSLYLPKGAQWKDAASGKLYEGGQTITVPAPLDVIPVFTRNGRDLPLK
jgi:alpha-D-xyloside xylohydrolase